MADDPENSGTRRSFVRAGAVVAMGAGASRSAETLALDGGPRAVQVPAERAAQIIRWPRYSQDEKRTLIDLLDNNRFYQEIPLLEDELKNSVRVPFVTFDLEDARKRITPLTRAVIPMHSAGNPCDMDQICAFAKDRGLVVVEDACQTWSGCRAE